MKEITFTKRKTKKLLDSEKYGKDFVWWFNFSIESIPIIRELIDEKFIITNPRFMKWFWDRERNSRL